MTSLNEYIGLFLEGESEVAAYYEGDKEHVLNRIDLSTDDFCAIVAALIVAW